MNTVEGAIVMSALTVVVGGLLAGFGTMATASATQSLARDVARAEAMGADGQALAHAKDPNAVVDISPTVHAGVNSVTVRVTAPAPLFDVHAEAVVVAEP